VSKKELLRVCGGIDYCTLCGYDTKLDSDYENLSSLHFHHLPKFEKKFNISSVYSKRSKYPRFSVSGEEIKSELKKCIVVCKNCHSLQHSNYERFLRVEPLIREKAKEWAKIQDELYKCGKKRINVFRDKHNKRYDRKHKSDPEENPFIEVDNVSSRDKLKEELERRMLNI